MSENDTGPNEAAPDSTPKPGPPVVPGPDSSESEREAQAREDSEGGAIPGEDPEDNPDLEGEERFDAG